MPPWEVTGEKLSRWRRYVWRQRQNVYVSEVNAKQRRDYNDMQLRNLRNGG